MPVLPTRELRFAYVWLRRRGYQAWQEVLRPHETLSSVAMGHADLSNCASPRARDAVRANFA